MNTPVSTTQPRSFADCLDHIRSLHQSVASATRALLFRHGWRHTCLNPARRWLWSKQLPGGHIVLADLNTALAIEASLAGQPPPPAATGPAPDLPPATADPPPPPQPGRSNHSSAR